MSRQSIRIIVVVCLISCFACYGAVSVCSSSAAPVGGRGGGTPLAGVLHQMVRIHLEGARIDGQVMDVGPQFLVIERPGVYEQDNARSNRLLVNIDQVKYIVTDLQRR